MYAKLASLLPPYTRSTAELVQGHDVLAVFRAAARIEPDPHAVMLWYAQTPIAELEGLTARALVASGRSTEVLTFLREIVDARRG